MKGIAKDHESITKDYGSLFYSMKDQCKKKFAFPSIGQESPAFMI